MKLWITGGQGMLGTSLQDLCRQKQIPFVASSRAEADLTDFSQLLSIARAMQPTHVINCAAYTDVDGAESNPEQAFAVNALGAGDLASIASQVGSKFVHISSDYVFDGFSKTPYCETDPCAPISVYGKSKWEAEKCVLEAFPRACVIRTSWLFGAKGKNFISSLLNWLQQKERLQVVADQCGLPTYVHDLAQAILDLLDAEGIVHFANAGPVSRYQLALDVRDQMILRQKEVRCSQIDPVPTAHFPTPARRPSYSVLSTARYSEITGKQPRPWKEAMGDYLDHASTS